MGGQCLKNYLGFELVKLKQLSKFNEDYIKKDDENSNAGYFLK